MDDQRQYWFPAKRYGWGWGFPKAWQGRVVLVIFFVLAGAGAMVLLPHRASAFAFYTSFLCMLLVAVCWFTGEPPRWRWGKK